MEYFNADWQIKIAKATRVDGASSDNIASMLSLPPSYYENRLKKIGFVGSKTRVLDAGCGAGMWSVAASRLNGEVVGIDANQKYLSFAQEINRQLKRKNLNLTLGKIEHLPFKDNYFDYVLSYCVWMYTDREKSLREMHRVLKPNGRIYLGAIAGLGWYLKLIVQGFSEGKRSLIILSLKAIVGRVYIHERQTRKLFTNHGFKILAIESDAQLGSKKIKVEPIYSQKYLGFWNVYEILAEKNK